MNFEVFDRAVSALESARPGFRFDENMRELWFSFLNQYDDSIVATVVAQMIEDGAYPSINEFKRIYYMISEKSIESAWCEVIENVYAYVYPTMKKGVLVHYEFSDPIIKHVVDSMSARTFLEITIKDERTLFAQFRDIYNRSLQRKRIVEKVRGAISSGGTDPVSMILGKWEENGQIMRPLVKALNGKTNESKGA